MAHCPGTPLIPKGTQHPQVLPGALEVIPADSITTGSQAEGKLFMESASNGQVDFYTHLHLPAWSGAKTMTVKINPGTQVNTIPLIKYPTLYPNKLTKSRYPKTKSLMPTHHTWISHDGSPKPFLGHFIVEVAHAKEPKTYPVRFYVFEDATSPHILLSYATSYRLGIISFQVPNLAATQKIDHIALPTPLVARGRPLNMWPSRTISARQRGPTQAAIPQSTTTAGERPHLTRVKKCHWLPAFPGP